MPSGRVALTRTFSAIAVLFAVFSMHGLSAGAYECHESPGDDGHGHDSVHVEEVPSSSDGDRSPGHHDDNLARCASAPCASAVVLDADLGPAHRPARTAVSCMAPWVLAISPSAPEPPVPKSFLLT